MSMKTPAAGSFGEITKLIEAARQKTFQVVNTVLIDLYWHVGKIISHKVKSAEWGDGVVEQLAVHIAQTQPGLRGFTRRNLFRMRQFYEAYCDDKRVSPLVRQLPWTHNLIILSQSKPDDTMLSRFMVPLTIGWIINPYPSVQVARLQNSFFKKTIFSVS